MLKNQTPELAFTPAGANRSGFTSSPVGDGKRDRDSPAESITLCLIARARPVSKPSLKAERDRSADIEFALSFLIRVCRVYCHGNWLVSHGNPLFKSPEVESDGGLSPASLKFNVCVCVRDSKGGGEGISWLTREVGGDYNLICYINLISANEETRSSFWTVNKKSFEVSFLPA